MPDTMPGNISKGSILRKFDYALRVQATFNQVQANLTHQNGGGDYDTALWNVFDGVIDPADGSDLVLLNVEKRHLRKHWLRSRPRSYWPGYRAKAKIVREAFVRACQTSAAAGTHQMPHPTTAVLVPTMIRPVVTYWLCAGHSFEVTVCEDGYANQVTVLLMTPSISYRYLGHRQLAAPYVNADNPDFDMTQGEGMYVYGHRAEVRALRHEYRWLNALRGGGDIVPPVIGTHYDKVKALEMYGDAGGADVGPPPPAEADPDDDPDD